MSGSTLSHHLDKLKNGRPRFSDKAKHIPAVYGQHRKPAGTAWLPLRGVLHP